jgi:hypothetical protein
LSVVFLCYFSSDIAIERDLMNAPSRTPSPRLSRYFSVLGALVLAFTFVVHDQLGEHARERVSDAQSAQLQFDLRQRLKAAHSF